MGNIKDSNVSSSSGQTKKNPTISQNSAIILVSLLFKVGLQKNMSLVQGMWQGKETILL